MSTPVRSSISAMVLCYGENERIPSDVLSKLNAFNSLQTSSEMGKGVQISISKHCPVLLLSHPRISWADPEGGFGLPWQQKT